MLKADIGRLTETVGNFSRAKGCEFRSRAEDQAARLRGQAEHKIDEIEQYVQANLATALIIAAGISLLVGVPNQR